MSSRVPIQRTSFNACNYYGFVSQNLLAFLVIPIVPLSFENCFLYFFVLCNFNLPTFSCFLRYFRPFFCFYFFLEYHLFTIGNFNLPFSTPRGINVLFDCCVKNAAFSCEFCTILRRDFLHMCIIHKKYPLSR